MADDTVQARAGSWTYGVETRSIDYVPETERHGRVWAQGPFWFVGDFNPFTVAIGFVGPLVGLTLGWTIAAAVLGTAFGTLFMAAHASQGPKMGLPQMIQSRAQFGYQGVVLPLLATGFAFVAFNVVDAIIVKEGLHGIFGWNATLVAVVLTVASAILAIYGHDWLHRVFQVLFWVSLPFWLILTVAVLTGHAGGHASHAGGFTWAGFLGMFTVCASYNITYAPYVSDYSRYLPRNTSTGKIIVSAYWGAVAAPVWLIPLGAWIATRLGISDALVGIRDSGNNVFGGLGALLLILSVLAIVAAMGLNAYSCMLTVVTAVDGFRPVRPTRRLRVVTIVALAILWLVFTLLLTNAISALNNALLVMLYLLAPWTAINLIDFFVLRHGRYAITDLFTPNGIYGSRNVQGITAYLVAIAVEIPFMYLPGFYESWGATHLNGVDISWIISLIVGSGLYAVLIRGHDRGSEQLAIERSEQVLAATGAAR
jgi:nucleobase:cation symporter-1, NCS1 family